MGISHPGEILKLEIKSRDLTILKASDLLNLDELTLSDILNGRGSITIDIAQKIEKVFGGTSLFWIRLQDKYNESKKTRLNE